MRTYLPEPNLRRSVRVLQRNELLTAVASASDTLNVLHEALDPETLDLFVGHPEVNKWRGNEVVLCEYALQCLGRLERMDPHAVAQQTTGGQTIRAIIQWHFESATSGEYNMNIPPFVGNKDFMEAERAELIRTDPVAYRRLYPLTSYATQQRLAL